MAASVSSIPLRTCPFSAPVLPNDLARVSNEFQDRRWPATPGTHVDVRA
jgi:hypothetical protein